MKPIYNTPGRPPHDEEVKALCKENGILTRSDLIVFLMNERFVLTNKLEGAERVSNNAVEYINSVHGDCVIDRYFDEVGLCENDEDGRNSVTCENCWKRYFGKEKEETK